MALSGEGWSSGEAGEGKAGVINNGNRVSNTSGIVKLFDVVNKKSNQTAVSIRFLLLELSGNKV